MAKRVFTPEIWRKIGQPDLNSKMFFIAQNGKKIWGRVTMVNFGHRKGIELNITPFRK